MSGDNVIIKIGMSMQSFAAGLMAVGRAMQGLDHVFRDLARELYISAHTWRWHSGGLYIGRNYFVSHGYCVVLMFWPRADCPEGEYSHHFTVEIGWDWAPTVVWISDGDDYVCPPFYQSELWTGRQWRVWSWRWPHSFSITRIARPL